MSANLDEARTVEVQKLFRRKPLLVEAHPETDGSWSVIEADRHLHIAQEDFHRLYELVEVDVNSAVDAGLPDLDPGTTLEREGLRLVRVTVVAGRGTTAYWHQAKPHGQDCGFRVIADMVDNLQASHRVGRFVEPWEGKAGGRTWVVLR